VLREGQDEEPVVDEDLLLHLCARHEALRIDDRPQLTAFRRTHALLEQRGLRSLLGLPLSAGGLAGVVVLCRAHPWAFVAAPLRELLPLAAMAAQALGQARALTRLERDRKASPALLPDAAPAGDAERDEALRLAAEAEQRLARAEAEQRTLREALEQRGQEIEALKQRLATALEAPRRTRRSRAAAAPKPPLAGGEP
jgi:GAF domain-containing protein